jgi:hypothetical protein
MTPDSRPAKPHQAAEVSPARQEGPTKATSRAKAPSAAVAAALGRPHLPAKPPSEIPPHREGDAPSAGMDAQQPPAHEPPDQQRPQRGEGSGEQYLRLRVRVDDGQLSIVDSHLVDGPLAQTTAFQGRFAYEVTDGRRLLHAGSIPDLGTVRGFAHPNGTLEQQRHHTYELSTYEFDARAPVALLRTANLANVSIALYRVKQQAGPDAPHPQLSGESLGVQREMQLREIGRVVRLPDAALPSDLQLQPPRAAPQRSQGRKIREEGGEDSEPDGDDRES